MSVLVPRRFEQVAPLASMEFRMVPDSVNATDVLRRRRIKCDESSMPCRQCVKSHRTCDGYAQEQRPFKLVLYGSEPADSQSKPSTPTSSKTKSFNATVPLVLPPSIGGLRTDSFNALPIEGTYDVQMAFDKRRLSGSPTGKCRLIRGPQFSIYRLYA